MASDPHPLHTFDISSLPYPGCSFGPLDGSTTGRDMHRLSPEEASQEVSRVETENRQLRTELEQTRAERDGLVSLRQQIMDLLGTRKPERLLHELRNLLNERELFRALADTLET